MQRKDKEGDQKWKKKKYIYERTGSHQKSKINGTNGFKCFFF